MIWVVAMVVEAEMWIRFLVKNVSCEYPVVNKNGEDVKERKFLKMLVVFYIFFASFKCKLDVWVEAIDDLQEPIDRPSFGPQYLSIINIP